MRIGICGIGCVGGATKYGMEKLGHDVVPHDIKLNTSVEDVSDCEIVYICVPTPENDNGSCDTSIVENIIECLINKHNYTGIIAVKSTVTPGTTERLNNKFGLPNKSIPAICFVPEFLRERHAVSDFTENHDVCVIGTNNLVSFELIKKSHGHYPDKFIRLTTTEAELSKYFSNVFNAMRITFANGFCEVCDKLGANYTDIKNAIIQRPTIKDLYLDCNSKFRGFGGVCLPKDSAAFAKLSKDLGVRANIFSTIVEDNKLYKTTVFDGMRK